MSPCAVQPAASHRLTGRLHPRRPRGAPVAGRPAGIVTFRRAAVGARGIGRFVSVRMFWLRFCHLGELAGLHLRHPSRAVPIIHRSTAAPDPDPGLQRRITVYLHGALRVREQYLTVTL